MAPWSENQPLRFPQASPRSHRVMVVDEDTKDLNFFTSVLEGMGDLVHAFTDHREAEWYLQNGDFDLVIMSQGRPILETHRLRRFTTGRNRCTPVVVVARYPEITCYVEALEHGATDYLEKPLSPVELERLVAKYCRPRQGESSAQESRMAGH